MGETYFETKRISPRPRWEEINCETEFETETKRLITHLRGEKQPGARSPVHGESLNSHTCDTCDTFDQSPEPGESVSSHPPPPEPSAWGVSEFSSSPLQHMVPEPGAWGVSELSSSPLQHMGPEPVHGESVSSHPPLHEASGCQMFTAPHRSGAERRAQLSAASSTPPLSSRLRADVRMMTTVFSDQFLDSMEHQEFNKTDRNHCLQKLTVDAGSQSWRFNTGSAGLVLLRNSSTSDAVKVDTDEMDDKVIREEVTEVIDKLEEVIEDTDTLEDAVMEISKEVIEDTDTLGDAVTEDTDTVEDAVTEISKGIDKLE